MEASMADEDTVLTVQNVAGGVLVELGPPAPTTVEKLKAELESQFGIQQQFMSFLQGGCMLASDAQLDLTDPTVTLAIDDSAQYLWDFVKNPDIKQIVVDGGRVTCPKMVNDYVNVVTQAPLSDGLHYVEFKMTFIGDEQWCGVVPDKALGWGKKVSGHSSAFEGCFYYCGRRHGQGALQIYGKCEQQFQRVDSGQTIGVAIDTDKRAAVFLRDGQIQGQCTLPAGPLYLLTHVDTRKDDVELIGKNIADAPAEALEALSKVPA